MADQFTDKQLAAKIYQVASLIKSTRFMRFFDDSCRFDTDLSLLFNKLRADLVFQLRQGLDFNAKREYRAKNNGADMPPQLAFTVFASQLEVFADSLFSGTFTKNDKLFTISRGHSVSDTILDAFDYAACRQINMAVTDADRFSPAQDRSFYQRNFISSFGIFIQSVKTLRITTPSRDFERALKSMISNVTFLVDGCPHDVLCHDAVKRRAQLMPAPIVSSHRSYNGLRYSPPNSSLILTLQ